MPFTEVDDLRDGPLDEMNGLWPLRPVHVRGGDYLVAWLYNIEIVQMLARGHFVVEHEGAPPQSNGP